MKQLKHTLNTFFVYLLLVILILTSGYIFVYYLFANTVIELRSLPPFLIVAIILYLLCQIFKRLLRKKKLWYQWIYIIGIISILLPLPLFSVQNTWIFTVTQVGSIFLLFPPIIELILYKRKGKNNSIDEELESE